MEVDSGFLGSNKVKEPSLCEECQINPSKYKCPCCSLRTCSLPCVTSHKKRTSCTGKRPVAEFVPISQFDDNTLLSDYNMLEDVKRFADSVKRIRTEVCGYSVFRTPLPPPLRNLRNAAFKRRTRLMLFSKGMSKREANRTYYNYKKKTISWTIEWRFHKTDVVLVDHGVHEDSTLCSVIENHLKPGPWKHALKQFCDHPLDSLIFCIRKYQKGVRSPFLQLNITTPLRDQLANKVILEYPVIHVLLPSHASDLDIISEDTSTKVNTKPADHPSPSPRGVVFKEEEIEDDGVSEPLVSDLLNQSLTDGHMEQMFGKESNGDSTIEQLLNADYGASGFDDMNLVEPFGGISCAFDFELDVDDKVAEQFLLDEELEEGEIM